MKSIVKLIALLGFGVVASLAQAVTNDTLTVTNHYNSSESESTATLGNLDNTIDSNQSIL